MPQFGLLMYLIKETKTVSSLKPSLFFITVLHIKNPNATKNILGPFWKMYKNNEPRCKKHDSYKEHISAVAFLVCTLFIRKT